MKNALLKCIAVVLLTPTILVLGVALCLLVISWFAAAATDALIELIDS